MAGILPELWPDGIYTLEVSKGYATASIPVSLSVQVSHAEDILLEPVTATRESPVILGASLSPASFCLHRTGPMLAQISTV